MLSAVVLLFGSPPRVRGKRTDTWSAYLYMRITPACAGKTFSGGEGMSNTTDHPRVCGENKLVDKGAIVRGGSPPRVRGKLAPHGKKPWSARITPACAGKTRAVIPTSSRSTDHPRVCGENLGAFKLALYHRGSPPRVRGKPCDESRRLTVSRITPACAGKTP